MKTRLLGLGIACALGMTGKVQAVPEDGDDLTGALTGGTPRLDLRLRYETVEQDNALKDAEALTLRTRLGYATGIYHGLRLYGEFEDVTPLVDDYAPEQGGYSVVADPEVSEINQAYIGYQGLPDTDVVFGRQRIIYDQARFVGNVGWRQNEQTFDGLRLTNGSLPDTAMNYAYVYNVDTILGGTTDIQAHLLNLAYSGLPVGTLTGYGYLLEFPQSPATSNQTWGLRLRGGRDLAGWQLSWLAELARQTDYKSGSSAIGADYRALELGLGVSGITAKLGYELLGADGFSGFETPLATKHAYNGWTDQFLNTPTTGLEDLYVSIGGSLLGTRLLAVYHDFSSDSGGMDYGTEWGLLAARKFGGHYSAGVKYASYSADGYSVDTDKLWVWVGLSF